MDPRLHHLRGVSTLSCHHFTSDLYHLGSDSLLQGFSHGTPLSRRLKSKLSGQSTSVATNNHFEEEKPSWVGIATPVTPSRTFLRMMRIKAPFDHHSFHGPSYSLHLFSRRSHYWLTVFHGLLYHELVFIFLSLALLVDRFPRTVVPRTCICFLVVRSTRSLHRLAFIISCGSLPKILVTITPSVLPDTLCL